ncbi:PfkB family carbohydrate kinase [Vibrio mediterranei]
MKRKDRIQAIRKLLINEGVVYVNSLAENLSVTERTIRRDLKVVCEQGIAELFFGGAKIINSRTAKDFKSKGINRIMDKLNYEQPQSTLKSASSKVEIDVYILGSFNVDIVSGVTRFPKVGETVRGNSTNFYAGGKGSNQATAASKVSDSVHLAVKVGTDEFSAKARSYLASTDINTFSIFESNEVPTGNAIIMVSEEEQNNMIAIDLGANESFTHEEIVSEFKNIKRSKVFLTQMENNFEITKSAIDLAHGTDTVVILNPAPYSDNVKDVIHMVDIITPNETEASDLSGVQVTDIDTAQEAATIIHSMGPAVVIITLGSNGCVVYDGEKCEHFETYDAVVVDTVGAGDSFNGALAASVAKGIHLHDAVKYASAFASLAVEREGASNMPEDSLVKARLNTK